MAKLKFNMVIALLVMSGNGFAAELTAEQCERYKADGYLQLTEEQKKAVLDSCKEKYSSKNAQRNCRVFAGEDRITELKKLAEAECK